MMRSFWRILSKVYSDIYCAGIHLPKLEILFNQPSKRLTCEYKEIIWADSAFTDKERILILEALDDLHYFCNGLVQLEIIFELDASDEQAIRSNCVLLRANLDHPAIKESDETIKSTTLGLCGYMANDTKRLYLVPGRLWNDIAFRTTATHELGHFIGLDHTGKSGIMYKSNLSNVLYPTMIDAKEVARIWNIRPKLLRYFKL